MKIYNYLNMLCISKPHFLRFVSAYYSKAAVSARKNVPHGPAHVTDCGMRGTQKEKRERRGFPLAADFTLCYSLPIPKERILIPNVCCSWGDAGGL